MKHSLSISFTLAFILVACASTTELPPDDNTLLPAAENQSGLAASQPSSDSTPLADLSTGAANFELSSPAFTTGQPIPIAFTCDGQDISPQLDWSAAPSGTQSFALIMDDPDAPSGVWVHWVLYNLPAELYTLPQSVSAVETLASGALHGKNSWRAFGYGGPCPPSGTHRYFFKLYALDILLDAPSSLSKQDLLDLIDGHILAETQLVGTFTRQ